MKRGCSPTPLLEGTGTLVGVLGKQPPRRPPCPPSALGPKALPVPVSVSVAPVVRVSHGSRPCGPYPRPRGPLTLCWSGRENHGLTRVTRASVGTSWPDPGRPLHPSPAPLPCPPDGLLGTQ